MKSKIDRAEIIRITTTFLEEEFHIEPIAIAVNKQDSVVITTLNGYVVRIKDNELDIIHLSEEQTHPYTDIVYFDNEFIACGPGIDHTIRSEDGINWGYVPCHLAHDDKFVMSVFNKTLYFGERCEKFGDSNNDLCINRCDGSVSGKVVDSYKLYRYLETDKPNQVICGSMNADCSVAALALYDRMTVVVIKGDICGTRYIPYGYVPISITLNDKNIYVLSYHMITGEFAVIKFNV